MSPADADDDDQFALAHAAWRQFHAMHLDVPAPTQPEIDGRLARYRRGHEADAVRDFGAATVLLGGIGKALADMVSIFARTGTFAGMLVFVLTCVLLLAIGSQSLARLRRAVEHHALAQRIGSERIDWSRADSMFADIRDADVRAYLHSVREQGRSLRRAEAALALERGRGARPFATAGPEAFRAHVRDGRSGPSRRDVATAIACLLAVAATHAPAFDPATALPALLLLGAWAFADLLGPVVQLMLDPWYMRGGGPACRRIRYALLADLMPGAAVVLAVVATSAGLVALSGP